MIPIACQGGGFGHLPAVRCGVSGRQLDVEHPENTLVPNAQSVTCPACRRIADNAAAGTLTVSGSFWPQHRGEIVHLFEHIEKGKGRALERIIHLTDTADELTVTTTGVHLANCLGHALEAATKRPGALPL